jgi:hypothetical protein
MESGREGCARESAPPTLAERVDEAIAAAERTLGAAFEFAGDAARSEARPVRGGCGMGAPVTGALTETPVEAIATRHGAPAVSRRIADPGGVVPAVSRKSVFQGRSDLMPFR